MFTRVGAAEWWNREIAMFGRCSIIPVRHCKIFPLGVEWTGERGFYDLYGRTLLSRAHTGGACGLLCAVRRFRRGAEQGVRPRGSVAHRRLSSDVQVQRIRSLPRRTFGSFRSVLFSLRRGGVRTLPAVESGGFFQRDAERLRLFFHHDPLPRDACGKSARQPLVFAHHGDGQPQRHVLRRDAGLRGVRSISPISSSSRWATASRKG